MKPALATALVFAFACLVASAAAAQEAPPPQRHPFDIPFPSPDPPYVWPNERGQLIECESSPFQRIDLGEVAGLRIYAGDGCSMPSDDPLSRSYKDAFRPACSLHDICYLGPGNTKRYCDDMFEWHMHRDCDRGHPIVGSPAERLFAAAAREQCHIAATAWRAGLETPLSTEYFIRSQDWGRSHCKIKIASDATATR